MKEERNYKKEGRKRKTPINKKIKRRKQKEAGRKRKRWTGEKRRNS
jgi:hypothetical protein